MILLLCFVFCVLLVFFSEDKEGIARERRGMAHEKEGIAQEKGGIAHEKLGIAQEKEGNSH